MSLGIKIVEATTKKVVVERTTRESKIKLKLIDGPRKEFKLNTGLAFLNHMLEQLAWRLCMNLNVDYNTVNFKLTHVMAEDTGIVLGTALKTMYEKKMQETGANGSGFAGAIIDEATARVGVSIEGRSNAFLEIPGNIRRTKKAEDTLTCDLIAFWEGLAQGMRATIQLTLEKAKDPHHAWEAAFRALGKALRDSLQKNEWRKGTTSGVKGTLE